MINEHQDITWMEAERDRLRAVRDEASADLDAVERVIALWRKAHRSQAKVVPPPVEAGELAGMKLLDAGIRVASKNGGVVTSTMLRELAVQAEILEDVPAASTAVYAVLNGDAFEKGAKRGEYRLVRPFAGLEAELSDVDWDSMPDDSPTAEELDREERAQREENGGLPSVRHIGDYAANGTR